MANNDEEERKPLDLFEIIVWILASVIVVMLVAHYGLGLY